MTVSRTRSSVLLLWAAAVLCASCAVKPNAQPTAQTQQQPAPTPFDYDTSLPLNVEVGEAKIAPAAVEERIEFDSPKGGRVAGLLIRPRKIEKPPVVLFLHGLGGSKKDARLAASLLVPEGIAVLGLDAACHGDRKIEGEEFFSPDLQKPREHIIQTVIDYRRAIDYLQTRDDVDVDRLGLIGASLGAILGSMVGGVDKRVDACLLIVGGGDWRKIISKSEHPAAQKLRDVLSPGMPSPLDDIDPIWWVGQISPRPVWMMNGRQDKIIPAAAAEALHQAAKQPKKVIWYDGGHMPPMPLIASAIKSWLKEWLVGAAPGE